MFRLRRRRTGCQLAFRRIMVRARRCRVRVFKALKWSRESAALPELGLAVIDRHAYFIGIGKQPAAGHPDVLSRAEADTDSAKR
jgi:hypothetical protein